MRKMVLYVALATASLVLAACKKSTNEEATATASETAYPEAGASEMGGPMTSDTTAPAAAMPEATGTPGAMSTGPAGRIAPSSTVTTAPTGARQ